MSRKPVANGRLENLPVLGATPFKLTYQPNTQSIDIQVKGPSGMDYAVAENPDTAPLIFSAALLEVIKLETPAQIAAFRATSSDGTAIQIAVQEFKR